MRPIDHLTFEDLQAMEADVKEIVDKVREAVTGKPTAAAYAALKSFTFAVDRHFENCRAAGDIFEPLLAEHLDAAAREVADDIIAVQEGGNEGVN